jgi:hypothetical protein
VIALGIGLVVVACGGIALAHVTTGGGPGFDVLSAGSAVQPPVSTSPAPTPAPPAPPAPAPTPPTLTGVSGLKVVKAGRRAKFDFGSITPGATFLCQIDSRPFLPCTSPFKAPRLGAGHHTFSVQAVDPNGLQSTISKAGFIVKKPASRHKKRHG